MSVGVMCEDTYGRKTTLSWTQAADSGGTSFSRQAALSSSRRRQARTTESISVSHITSSAQPSPSKPEYRKQVCHHSHVRVVRKGATGVLPPTAA